jgi:hypothetical protein
MKQPHRKFPVLSMLGKILLLALLILIVFSVWQYLNGFTARALEGAPVLNGPSPHTQPGEGNQVQSLDTDSDSLSKEGSMTPQAAPLGTEQSPAELACLKRQMENTNLPSSDPQQADPSP